MEKQPYTPPELEIIRFSAEDVIVTSSLITYGENETEMDWADPHHS